MVTFLSRPYPEDQKLADTESMKKVLMDLGAEFPDDFVCIGRPYLSVSDATQSPDAPFDPLPFKGRIKFGGNIVSADIGHAPGGLSRLTIARTSETLCGAIIVGRSDLNCTSITSSVGVTIGDNVHFEPRVTILDSPGHPVDRRIPDIPENRTRASVVIEDDVWIGYGVTITPGVTLGKGAVVKPGSVVMWDVPSGAVVGGNPAKSMKIFKRHFNAE